MTKVTKTGNKSKWKNPIGTGTLFVRGGWLWTRIGEQEKTCRPRIKWPDTIEDQKKAVKAGIAQLKRRALEREYPQLKQDVVTIPSLYRAAEEFVELRSAGKPRTTRQQIVQGLHHYIIATGSDVALTAETLRQRLLARWKSPLLARDSVNSYATIIRAFCGWCVDRGYIQINPLASLGDPVTKPEVPNAKSLTVSQVNDLIQYCQDHNNERWTLIFRFLFLTGIRPGEFNRLQWSHLMDDGIRIIGKRVSSKSAIRGVGNELPFRERFFPFWDADGGEIVPGLPGVVQQMQGAKSVLGNAGSPYVNPYTRDGIRANVMYTDAQRIIQAVFGSAAAGVTVKSLRKAAINYWRDVLFLPVDIRAALAGHTESVQVSSYLTEQRTPDLQKRIAMERKKVAL